MKLNRFLLCALVFLASGCANLTTISRHTDLPDGGVAIHLDALQRLVYTKKDDTLCAEPSPDAMQAVAAALAAGVSLPSEGAGSFSQALQQSTGSIGLRTQSITLMRDSLYRICEAYHNKAISELDVMQLLERSQDLSLGVLAIEQLTGAVVARQVVLTGHSYADASADIVHTQRELDSARAAEEQRKQALDVANTKLATDRARLKEDQARDPKTDANAAEMTALNDTTIPADVTAQQNAQNAYDEAHRATMAVVDNFNAAVTGAEARASGSGFMSAPAANGGPTLSNGGPKVNKDAAGTPVNKDAAAGGTPVNKDTAPGGNPVSNETAVAISGAVSHIVDKILDNGHLTDACMNVLNKEVSNSLRRPAARMLELCEKVIEADLEKFKLSKNGDNWEPAEEAAPVTPAPPPPRPR